MKLSPELESRILAMPGVRVNGRAVGPVQTPAPEFESEKDFQSWVIEQAESNGWDWYHTFNSKRSKSGYPDLMMWRERVLFAEVKSEDGVVSATQANVIDDLRAAGAEVYVWRPSDMLEVVRVLAGRPRTAREWMLALAERIEIQSRLLSQRAERTGA